MLFLLYQIKKIGGLAEGILIPAVILLISVISTFLLYRYFSKQEGD